MKKIIILLLSLFALASCGIKDNHETVSGNNAVSDGKHDREILDEYKNIEIGGEHEFRILFVNVGKADSIIIEIDGLYYMIDTGTSESVPYTIAALNSLGVERIEGIFLTHPDRDHVGGYSYIRERYEVGGVYCSSICGDMYVIEGITKKDSLVKLDPGAAVKAAEGVYFEVLGPIKYNSLDDNDNSLVLKLTVNGVTALFAGDMKFDEESTLLDAGMDLDCDILKVGYHGRKDSTSSEFLSKATPKYSVISTSQEEESDTAHISVVTLLENSGSEVYVTEDYGLGIMFEVSASGEITCENYETAAESEKIKISSVSKTDQTVTMTNKTDGDIDISGWFIVSSRGGEVFCFPEGTVISAGSEFILACNDYEGKSDIVWNESKVWNEDKSDKASLIDTYGNLVDDKKSK